MKPSRSSVETVQRQIVTRSEREPCDQCAYIGEFATDVVRVLGQFRFELVNPFGLLLNGPG